jgi:hypothetical protein
VGLKRRDMKTVASGRAAAGVVRVVAIGNGVAWRGNVNQGASHAQVAKRIYA